MILLGFPENLIVRKQFLPLFFCFLRTQTCVKPETVILQTEVVNRYFKSLAIRRYRSVLMVRVKFFERRGQAPLVFND